MTNIDYTDLIDIAPYDFDRTKDAEVQTDKHRKKALPCVSCKRPLITSAFYVPANARCSICKTDEGANGPVGVPKPGRTDPARAARLEDCLLNKNFAKALCPCHPDDEEHVMVLKSIAHSDRYGPSRLIGRDSKGNPMYKNEVGESVLLQCTVCKAVTSHSTMHQAQYRKQNEPKNQVGDPSSTWTSILGVKL